MKNMDKTTKNNPAAFQKVSPSRFLKIIKDTVKKVINGQNKVAINFFRAGLLNYFFKFKRKNQFYCNLCKCESPNFLHTANEKRILYNSICPNCSGRKRHRGLYEEYKKILNSFNSPNILHFAPEPVFYNLFQDYKYTTADLELNDVDCKYNIQNIDCESKSFDLIFCNHVLEHVEDDILALNELERILKPSGVLIFTVPGNWNRSETLIFDELDSNGHFRDYGLDLIIKLKKIFYSVDTVDLYKYNNV